MVEMIGINAGKVWSKLDEKGRMNVKNLRKAVKLTEKDMYAAFGWLAKEEKLILEKVEKDIYVELC